MSTMNSIGRYQLLERIALGGMAEIFLAFERGTAGFERLVVIKRLRQEFASDDTYLEMFLREARTIARLNHPNIVKVHELGEHEGSWYIAMEYVAGASFRELLVAVRAAGQKLPLNVAVGLLLRACAGAHGAHELRDSSGQELGLVHRDISPDNLMVETTGHVKLLDFGIAKVVTRDESTRLGTLKGKIAYMSPEQCQQRGLDRRSDVFSLGIVGWELIAAARLFRRENDYESMQAIVNGDVLDLREYREDCPEALVAIVHMALSANPDDRFPSADVMRRELIQLAERQHLDVSLDALAPTIVEFTGEWQSRRAQELEAAVVAKLTGPDDLDLDDLLAEEPPTPPVFRRPRPDRRPELLLGGGVLLALVVGLGIWAMQAQQPEPQPLTPEEEEPIAAPTGAPMTIALAPVMDETLYLEAHEGLRAHLELSLDRPVLFKTFDSYDDLGAALVGGEVEYASLPPFLYIQTVGESPDIELLAMKLIDGSSGSDGVLLVREDSPAKSIEDLQGRRICFTDPSSTTGWALPRAALRRVGALGEDVHLSGNHLQAIRDLDSGLCEAAATYSGAWLGADRAGIRVGQLRVLGLTGRSPQDAMVAAPETHETERAAMREALLSFEDPGAAGVERITGYVAAEDGNYEALREALAEEVR